MSSGTRSGANLAAGAFLIIGLIGFVVISAVISDALERFGDSESYTVRFDVRRGAPGLSVGSTVTLGGQPVGRVTAVEFVRDPAGASQAVDVGIRVDADQPLYTDAAVVLVRPLVGGASSMNIISVGTPEAGRLDPGGRLAASTAAPGLLADAGFGDTQIEQLQGMIAQAAEFVDRSARVAARLDEDIAVITEDAKSFSATLRETTDRVSERLPEIQDDVAAAAETIAEAGAGLDRAARATESFIADAQAVLSENRPRIDETMRSVQEIAARIETEHAPAAMELIAEASRAARDLGDTAERIEALIAEGDPSIRRSLANARLASDQLRQASVEIRRNPWRLLARPDTKELESEILYDATRTHADAASDLRDAAASLEILLGASRNVESGEEDARLARLRAEVGEALERYQRSQDALMDLIDKQ